MMLTKEQKEQATMLIRFYNLKSGARCWFSDNNIEKVYSLIELAGGDVEKVRIFFRENVKEGVMLHQICDKFRDSVYAEKHAQTVPAQPVDNLAASMNVLGQVVTDLLARTKMDEIQATVGEALKEEVKKFIADNYGPITRKVNIEFPDRKVELDGVVHAKFDTVLKFVQANEPVYLIGPAGTGKNVLCKQIAKAMGLKFYFTNAVTQEYKLTGFTDAMGTYHESQFYKAFKNGGLFMLDEMDASIPEVLNILNAAIANRYFDFPAPVGYVEAHPDFRVIAAGNTFGLGADYEYVGRNQLDAASLDRFFPVRIDYDSRIEEACANGDTDLVQFCRKFRKATQRAGIRTIVSYRAISAMAKMSAVLNTCELLETCLIKAMEIDDLNAIKADMGGCGKYSAAFEQIIDQRKAG